MKMLRITGGLSLCLFALSLPTWGQQSLGDARLAASVAAAQKQYTDSFAGSPKLYNGPEYVDYAKRYHAQIGHQFFSAPDRQPGSVEYNNQVFNNLRLNYDVVLDQVVLQHPTSPLTMRLINEQMRAFTLNDHQFVRLVADSASRNVIRTGYYEVLVDSQVQLLAKRAKRQQEQIIDGKIDVAYFDIDELFIKKGGVYHLIRNKSSVVRLLADRNKEIQRYIQEHKLNFNKKQREAATVELLRYYSSLRS
ncbi:hypothetical protein I2I05_00455 [Hymenobacter sp. BT683]|uniref:Uncharacterized protein n=1 Tax=Hymenobacter jeongseonensis TaxID=2791027 RepID=A0ABS0IC16_9BACT|nr:hypothetical protein [Hymenobacter jeongseonensis]MBF9235855.1 hypothetical protein [Hymenobacter jeongseonensis]